MFDKKAARLRRAKKTRAHIRYSGVHRLVVNRTPRHIYAQIISPTGGEVLAQASTLDETLRSGATGNVDAATAVGLATVVFFVEPSTGLPQALQNFSFSAILAPHFMQNLAIATSVIFIH